MLSAYLQRSNGETQAVGWQHVGQHLAVQDGSVRLARLFWERGENGGPEQERAVGLLLESVPLMDWLVLTRGESVVFHGLITECTADGANISLIASDNPKVQRLFEQPWQDGSLRPSDEAPGASGAGVPSQPSQVPGQVVESAGDPAATQAMPKLAGLEGAVQVRRLGPTTPLDPAARPGGHPAGQVPMVPSAVAAGHPAV